MKIAVTGANGQLGSDICAVLRKEKHEVIELNHDAFDIINYEFVETILKDIKPDVLINPAAYHHVEKCQNDPDMAFSVNATAPFNMAKVCKELDALFIHISTDYVFDGLKNAPYLEVDCANPEQLWHFKIIRRTNDRYNGMQIFSCKNFRIVWRKPLSCKRRKEFCRIDAQFSRSRKTHSCCQ